MNAGFYDGHVELLGDLEGSNPRMWMPKGTAVANANAEMWTDTYNKFVNAPGTANYMCP